MTDFKILRLINTFIRLFVRFKMFIDVKSRDQTIKLVCLSLFGSLFAQVCVCVCLCGIKDRDI